MRAGMKDLAGEPSCSYSQVAKYRFKNPGESSSPGVSIKVDSNTVSAGTLSSNVKNLEKASAAVKSKDSEGQSSTPQDPSGTSTTESAGDQELLGTTDDSGDAQAKDGTKEPDVPAGTQVDRSGHTEDPPEETVVESTKIPETTDMIGSSGTSKDAAVNSDLSKDTCSPSSSQTSKIFGDTSRLSDAIGGVVAFFESVKDNNDRGNSGNTTDPPSSDVTVTSTSETSTKPSSEDQTKSMTSDDDKSSEVVPSQDDKQSEKQSGMIYTMTR